MNVELLEAMAMPTRTGIFFPRRAGDMGDLRHQGRGPRLVAPREMTDERACRSLSSRCARHCQEALEG